MSWEGLKAEASDCSPLPSRGINLTTRHVLCCDAACIGALGSHLYLIV